MENPQRGGVRVALTGVPGTGKTTITRALAARGARVLHLNEYAAAHGLLGAPDPAHHDAREIDLDALDDALREDAALAAHEGLVVLEGHFAHELAVDAVVLLRCDPLVLIERLRARGWPEAKVRENVEAEALDVLAQEVLDADVDAWEVDTTHLRVEEAADTVQRIAEGGSDALKARPVGSARWPLESLPWF